jgi:hypothetical protein
MDEVTVMIVILGTCVGGRLSFGSGIPTSDDNLDTSEDALCSLNIAKTCTKIERAKKDMRL